MCILVNLSWHLLLLEKLAAWACIMSFDGKCKSGKKTWITRLGQYWVLSPLAGMIAALCGGMLATRLCRCSIGIFPIYPAGPGQSSPRFWGGLCLLVIARPKSSQIWGCSLTILQAGDVALLKEIKDCPSTVSCGIIIWVAVAILEMLPGKWHQGVS